MAARSASQTNSASRSDTLPRPRLFETLDNGERLVLLCAPAGFGKTTLLSSWLSRAALPAAWLTMQSDDATPRFNERLAAAREALPSEARACAVVLDDYQEVKDRGVHAAVDELIERLPNGERLLISSRSEPPLALARLRARGELAELRAADLRFTVEETAAFFTGCGLELPLHDAAALATKTGGWPAGLRLAAISMAGASNRKGFIARFSGTNRHVADFLGDEVLRRLPTDQQEFLLATSILGKLCAGICTAVTGREDSQAVLEALEAEGLFLEPMDDERTWYRWHTLFADVLRARLARAPLDAGELHRRAAAWWEARGSEEEAVRHRLAAREFQTAADLIDKVAEKVMRGGRSTTFLGWVDALPGTARDGHPSLGVYHDVALAVAEAATEDHPSGDPLVDGGRAAARAFSEFAAGRMDASIASAESALAVLPEDRSWLRGSASLLLANARLSQGDLDLAARDLALLLPRARRDGNYATATECLQRLCVLDIARGNTARARAHAEEALRFAFEGAPSFSLRATLWFLCALARLHLLAGNAAECAISLERTRVVAEQAGVSFTPWRDELETGLLLLKGDRQGAVARAARSERAGLMPRGVSPEAREEARRCAALSLLAGELEPARAWVSLAGCDRVRQDLAQGRGFGEVPYLAATRELALAARIELAEGRPTETLAITELVAAEAEAHGDIEVLLECLVLRVLALDALGRPCGDALSQAVERAAPSGFAGLLVIEGPRMAALLYPLCAEGPHAAAVGAVLALFTAGDQSRAFRDAPRALVEPLSAREIEILRLLAAGLSNREIADRIFVSEKTVKWHATNIYGKLGVARRTQAVAKARSMGILAPEGET